MNKYVVYYEDDQTINVYEEKELDAAECYFQKDVLDNILGVLSFDKKAEIFEGNEERVKEVLEGNGYKVKEVLKCLFITYPSRKHDNEGILLALVEVE